MPNTHIALLLSLLAGFASCSILSPADKHESTATAALQADTTVIFGDTIDNIILNADRIVWYEVMGLTESADTTNKAACVLGFPVKNRHKADKDRVLSFILSDKDWFIRNYPPVRQQFLANIIFVFHKKHAGNVGMLVSFGSGEIAVTDVIPENEDFTQIADVVRTEYLMRDPRILARWLAEKLPEDTYYKEYIKL